MAGARHTGRGFGVVKDKVKNISGANIEVWIVEKGMLHMLFIEYTVYLGPGPLHEAVRLAKNTELARHTQTAAPFERFKI